MEPSRNNLVGAGSYGKVYYSSIDKSVTKVFDKTKASTFIREVSISLYLSRWPYFVRIKDYDIQKLHMKMEPWAADLWRITKSNLGTHSQRLAIFIDVLKGVYIMHQLGLVHSDIKSANIMVSEVGSHFRAALADFGLTSVKGYSDIMLTTNIYAEPIRSHDFSHDIYSLGIVALELFADITFVRQSNYVSALVMVKRIKDPVLSGLIRRMLCPVKDDRIDAKTALISIIGKDNLPSVNLSCTCSGETRYLNQVSAMCVDKAVINPTRIARCLFVSQASIETCFELACSIYHRRGGGNLISLELINILLCPICPVCFLPHAEYT